MQPEGRERDGEGIRVTTAWEVTLVRVVVVGNDLASAESFQ